MITSAKEEVQLLVELMKQAGITNVVLSPGSRNAPLTIAFDEHPDFDVIVIPDERSAAFYAMGMAQQLGKPVAIACTSGSAPLNYFPAVVEAYYQQIPLLVLTADRPSEWIDHGDGQTIRQQNVFGTHMLDSYHLVQFAHSDKKWQAQLRVSELLQKAIYQKGPVHINLPFSEPLYELKEVDTPYPVKLVRRFPASRSLSVDTLHELRALISASQKCMLIVGQKRKDEVLDVRIRELAESKQVAVLVEHTANVHGATVVEPIDSVLAEISGDTSYYPDVVIQIGGAVVSKRIKKFLRDAQAEVITVDQQFPFSDTFQGLNLSLDVAAETALEAVLNICQEAQPKTDFAEQWIAAKERMLVAHERISNSLPYSDFKVVEHIMGTLPSATKLHFSNSSMIRYGLLFYNTFQGEVFCNRGTSGIDGCTSTASGAALADPEHLHVLVTGDLSFFYDSNALWNEHFPENLRVIVVNNEGGDIFNIIPGPSGTNQLNKVFVAKHNFDARGVTEGFKVSYAYAENAEQLSAALEELLLPAANGRGKVLEVNTARVNNSGILKQYFERLAAK